MNEKESCIEESYNRVEGRIKRVGVMIKIKFTPVLNYKRTKPVKVCMYTHTHTHNTHLKVREHCEMKAERI